MSTNSRNGRAVGLVALAMVSSIWDRLQTAIIVVGGILLVAIQVPGVQNALATAGFSKESAGVGVILPLVLIAIYIRLTEVSRDLNRTVLTREIFNGAPEVYPKLDARLRLVKKQDERTLQVIGMNLKTAWPTVNLWFPSGKFDGWQISISGFIDRGGRHRAECNPSWSEEASRQLASALRESQATSVLERGIEIRTYEYSHLPAIHGFRLGNGDLFISFLTWDESGSHLRIRSYTYEFVPKEDQSAAAEATRDLWDSWWRSSTVQQFQNPIHRMHP